MSSLRFIRMEQAPHNLDTGFHSWGIIVGREYHGGIVCSCGERRCIPFLFAHIVSFKWLRCFFFLISVQACKRKAALLRGEQEW